MANKVKVEILGDASSLNRALKSAGKESQTFHTVSVAAFAAVGAALLGIGAAAKIGFTEFSAQARVGAQTAAVIKSTGGEANVTKEHVINLADSLMKLSGADDEAIQTGENMLLTFRNIRNESGAGNDIFDQSTVALMDMATAMNGGATPSSEELGKTAIKLGKALNDPLVGMTALGRMGVQFTVDQKEQIKTLLDTGQTAKEVAADQKKAAADVETAHAAVVSATEKLEAAEDTAADASDTLKTAQENLRTAQQNAKTAQTELTQARKDAKRAVDDLKDSLRDAKNSEEGASIALKRAQEALKEVMADSTSTDLDKREAILGVKEAEASLDEAQDKRKETQRELNKRTKEGVEGSPEVITAHKNIADASKSVASASHDAADASGELNDAHHKLSGAQKKARDASKKLADANVALRDAQQEVVGGSPSLENRIKAQKIILAELTKEFGGSAKAAGQTLPGKLNILKESFNNLAGKIVGTAAPALTDFANAALKKGLPAIEKFSKGITTAIAPAVKEMAKAFKDAWPGIRTFIEGVGEGIEELAPVFEELADIGAATMRALGDVMEEHGDDIREIFENLGKVVKNVGKVVLPILAFAFERVLPAALRIAIPILELVSETLVFLTGIFADTGKAVRSFCNFFTTTIPNAFKSVISWLKSNWPKVAAVISGPFAPIVLLATDGFGIRSKLLGAFQDVLDWLGGLKSKITGVFSGAARWLSDAGGDIVGGLEAGFKAAWDGVSGVIGWLEGRKAIILGVFSLGATWLLPKGWDLISGLLGSDSGGMKGSWSGIASWLGERAAAIGGFFGGALTWLSTAGYNIIHGLGNGIWQRWSEWVGWFGGISGRFVGFFDGCVTWLKDKGFNIIHGLGNGIVERWSQWVDWFGGISGRFWNFFDGCLTWLHDRGYNIIHGLGKGISQRWGEWVDWFGGIGARFTGFFSGAGDWLKDAGANVMSGLAAGIRGAAGTIEGVILAPINAIIRAWNDLELAFPDWHFDTHIPGIGTVGWNSFKIKTPNISYLGTGGIVTSPTLAMIGERGPEAVVPLGKGYGGTTVINVAVSNVWGDADKAALMIRDRLKAMQNSGQLPNVGLA